MSSTQKSHCPAPSHGEFIALLALCMSLVALSIDSMLPALPAIGSSFGITHENDQQFVVTALFAGLAIGQLLVGPLSDSFGRKRTVYYGLGIFMLGCLCCYFAPTYELMLVGRFTQGLGAAAPRIVTVAIVRDRYEGREMARIMSYIMGIFIMFPALAPTIGQFILSFAPWQGIFLALCGVTVILFIWFASRLEETLHPEDKRPFTLPCLLSGIWAVLTNRATFCYLIASGFIFGAFIGYLNSSQQIFQNYYHDPAHFPQYFAMTALAIGAAFFVNAKLVMRYGMRKVIVTSLITMAVLAGAFIPYELSLSGAGVPLPVFLSYMVASSFCMGMLFGNFNALAMEPMGHMAGIASAVIGCLSLVMAASGGALIGLLYTDNFLPITIGFLVLSLLSLGMMAIAEGKNPSLRA